MGLGDSEKYRDSDARVVGWVSQDGKVHTVENQLGEVEGRKPSDYSLEHAKQVRIAYTNPRGGVEWVSVENFTPDYDIDDALDETTDTYYESRSP